MLAYFIVCEAFFGATLGKIVAEIQVKTSDGGTIGVRAAVIRNIMRVIDGIGGYLVAAFSVILTSRHVRLGNLAAGTAVMKRVSGRAPRVSALLAALLVAIGGIAGGFAVKSSPATTGMAAPGAARPVTSAPGLARLPDVENVGHASVAGVRLDPCDVVHAGDDVRDAVGAFRRTPHPPGVVSIGRQVPGEERQAGRHGHERVVDLVRRRARQQRDGAQRLRLTPRGLRRLRIRDVDEEPADAADAHDREDQEW
jgi:hypothetical protein